MRKTEAVAKAKKAIARVKIKGMATIDDYRAVEAGFLALASNRKQRPKRRFGDPYSPKGYCF